MTGPLGVSIWRWVVLLVTAVYFLLPLWAALRFAGIGAFGSVVGEAGFTSSLALSVRLAVITTLITIALILPTAVYVHLRLPKLRRLLEGITILPIVIPPVVLIVGVLAIAPGVLKGTSLLLALFVTWIFLLAITVLGSRQSRKTGGGEVTLFTVARTQTRGD